MLFVNSFISRYSPQLSKILGLCKQGPHWSHSLLLIWSIVLKDGKCIFTKLLTCYPGPSHPHLDPIYLYSSPIGPPEVVSIRLKRKKKRAIPRDHTSSVYRDSSIFCHGGTPVWLSRPSPDAAEATPRPLEDKSRCMQPLGETLWLLIIA